MMSSLAVSSSLPIHLEQAQSNTPSKKNLLNRFITESPHKNYQSHLWQKRLWMVASVISVIAIVVIAAAIFIASNLTTLSFGYFLLMLGASFLTVTSSKMFKYSSDHGRQAEIEKGVIEEMKAISPDDIPKYMREMGISTWWYPKDELKKIDPKNPLRPLLPAIARYHYWLHRSHQVHQRAMQLLQSKHPDEDVRLISYEQGWNLLEREVFSSRIKAACMIHMIAHPCIERSVPGSLKILSFAERLKLRTFENRDPYFVFHDQNKDPITFEDLTKMSVQKLSAKLFA